MSELPKMAKQLEVSLYRSAQTLEAYNDVSTLKARIQLVAGKYIVAKDVREHFAALANFNINYGLLREMPGIWSSQCCSASDSSWSASSSSRKRKR